MVLIFVAVLLGVAGLVWLWKIAVSGSADSLQEGGSSKTESYVVIFLVITVLGIAFYMIIHVV